MLRKITLVQHRHSDLAADKPDLVLEVGRTLPPFYQAGRRAGLRVKSIEGDDPLRCTLDNGDVIFIGKGSVRGIRRRPPDA